MSVTSKNSSHRRNDSGEIVVFDAARYFSGVDDNSSSVFHGGAARNRMSLDMPAINAHNLPTIQKQYLMREKKKYKQPSSPGGRLASFLNSLFNQANSKKKKKSKTSAAAADDDHHAHDKRRSSISLFRIMTSSADNYCDSKSTYSAKTPTKSSYFSDRRKANGESVAGNERLRFNNGSFRNPTTKWTADHEDQRKFGDGDGDGEDSDSSSDLFDLPNLDFYSTGLPVYGTTDMDRIRIGAPVSSAAT
ncbi:protein BIG GRAIN 1-like E [Salvia miltiorrhiza]|uniref:protein BIG GRAIN 1-like E n=1 Tax=Salvia miltiorrhiza TaxID=226208 RepID=UPI0025ABF976|nr:protein BIG GRAIN 1-like E [Salvia miltiorrhiza]